MSKSITFKPVDGRILVLPDPPTQETSFGLLLPGNKERPVTGTVVVGNKKYKKGQRILFSLFGLDEMTLDDKVYSVVSDSGVLGIYA